MSKLIKVTIEAENGEKSVIECDGFFGTRIQHVDKSKEGYLTDRYFQSVCGNIDYSDGCRAIVALASWLYDDFIKAQMRGGTVDGRQDCQSR